MSERICWNVILLQTLQQPNNKQDPMGENFFQARITMGEKYTSIRRFDISSLAIQMCLLFKN